jgi:hypothetical protein
MGAGLRRTAAFQHVRDTGGRDGESAGVVALDESLLSQVPDVERHE